MDDIQNKPQTDEEQIGCCCGDDCTEGATCCGGDCPCASEETAVGQPAPTAVAKDDSATPPHNDPAAPPPDALATAQAQCEEYLAGWKRCMADYANLKKESERDRTDMAKYAASRLIGELLPVLDSFKKASAETPAFEPGQPLDAAKAAQWAAGIQQIRGQLESALKKSGIEAIEAADVPFDPHVHEAMMMRHEEGKAPGLVLQVLQPGYRLHDRVVRAARVIVSE